MLGQIEGFEWDQGNRLKCQQHGVSLAEIEALFGATVQVAPDPAHSHAETRYLAIGKTGGGRHVFLAFTIRTHGERRLIRPISARYMHAKEVMHYEKQTTKTDQ